MRKYRKNTKIPSQSRVFNAHEYFEGQELTFPYDEDGNECFMQQHSNQDNDRSIFEFDYIKEVTCNWTKEGEKGRATLYSFYDLSEKKSNYGIMINYELKYILDPDVDDIKVMFREVANHANGISFKETRNEVVITIDGPFDRLTIHKSRKEQKKLRQALRRESTVAACAICTRVFTWDFLVVAHIKKRSLASSSERADLPNVVPMCLLGCDALFERGFVGIKKGRVVTLKQPDTEDLSNFVATIEGKMSGWLNADTEKYFEWHIDHHSF